MCFGRRKKNFDETYEKERTVDVIAKLFNFS
jgi:hypothetical protein